MTIKIQIGVTCLLTFLVLLCIAVKSYLFIGRRVGKEERGLMWEALKCVVPAVIALMTGIKTIFGWFDVDLSVNSNPYVDVYLYFLICVSAIINSIDNYKKYKIKEEEVRKKK